MVSRVFVYLCVWHDEWALEREASHVSTYRIIAANLVSISEFISKNDILGVARGIVPYGKIII